MIIGYNRIHLGYSDKRSSFLWYVYLFPYFKSIHTLHSFFLFLDKHDKVSFVKGIELYLQLHSIVQGVQTSFATFYEHNPNFVGTPCSNGYLNHFTTIFHSHYIIGHFFSTEWSQYSEYIFYLA